MEIVAHRVNGIEELSRLPKELGAEVDIRSRAGRLILAHDPHAEGPELSAFLKAYALSRRGSLLILNPKEDGLDGQALELLAKHKIERFFFLDLSFPSLVRLALRQGERRVAVRVSEYEPAEAAERLAGRAEWAWLDCFEGKPPDLKAARRLRKSFKLCLVSPELEGHPKEAIAAFRALQTEADAVCTKHPELWR